MLGGLGLAQWSHLIYPLVILVAAGLWLRAQSAWADICARTVMAPEDVPIGIITGLVGGLFFIGVLAKR